MKDSDLTHEKNKLAYQRWKILAHVLFKHSSMNDILYSSKFENFKLFNKHLSTEETEIGSEWYRYSAVIGNITISVKIRHMLNTVTPENLIGFNNTGNLCVWPSEEILAYYAICNRTLFNNKRVLEVGSGMTSLAGILISKYTNCSCCHMSDGNTFSVCNISCILKANQLNDFNISCFVLKWNNYLSHTEKYDIIICADCIFFDDSRSDLIKTLWYLLLSNGMVLITAPKRGNSLWTFLKESTNMGFHYSLYNYYNDHVWKRHMQLLQCDQRYKPDIHYPLLIILTKGNIIPEINVIDYSNAAIVNDVPHC